MQSTRPAPLALAALSLGLLAACHDGSSGSGGTPTTVLAESEPNDTPAQATAITLARAGSGSASTAGDVDLWSLDLETNEVVRIEVFATRFDQDTWATEDNVPRLTVLDTDGTTKLLEHDFGGNLGEAWGYGKHDLDIPMFRAPIAGTYYVQVTQDDDTSNGGAYLVRATEVDLGVSQFELEATGVSGENDLPVDAEAIEPGHVLGNHVDGGADCYSFTIAGSTVVEFEVFGYRNGAVGGAYLDSALSLIDVDGTTLLTTDDHTIFKDAALRWFLTTAGTYTVCVGNADGSANADYVLRYAATDVSTSTVETEPNETHLTAEPIAYDVYYTGIMDNGDADYFAFTGVAGDLVHFETFSAANGAFDDGATFALLGLDGVTPVSVESAGAFDTPRAILPQDGIYFVLVTSDGSPQPTTYMFRLRTPRAGSFETEPNENFAQAESFPVGGSAAGVIATAGDVDAFAFEAQSGEMELFTLYAGQGIESAADFAFGGNGSTLTGMLVIRNENGDIVAKCDEPGNVSGESVTNPSATVAIAFVAATSGTYTIEVADTGGTGADTHTWVLVRE